MYIKMEYNNAAIICVIAIKMSMSCWVNESLSDIREGKMVLHVMHVTELIARAYSISRKMNTSGSYLEHCLSGSFGVRFRVCVVGGSEAGFCGRMFQP